MAEILEMWDVIVKDLDNEDNSKTFTFATEAEAEAFRDGVEYVNDDAIQAVEIKAWLGRHDPDKDEFIEDEPEFDEKWNEAERKFYDDFDEALWEERMLHGPEGNRL